MSSRCGDCCNFDSENMTDDEYGYCKILKKNVSMLSDSNSECDHEFSWWDEEE